MFDVRVDPNMPRYPIPLYRPETQCILYVDVDEVSCKLAGYRYSVIMIPIPGLLLRWQWDRLFEGGPVDMETE